MKEKPCRSAGRGREAVVEAYVTPENLRVRTDEWLAAIAGVNRHRMNLRTAQAALLVVDMQNYFADPGGRAWLPCTRAILPNIVRLTGTFRAARRPVIYTRHVHHPELLDAGIMYEWWGDMILEGTPDSEIHPALAPRARDKIITKHRYSAFHDTDLATVLRTLRIEELVIAGVMTNLCCETTARDAFMRDYRVFFPADATGTNNEEMHRASLLNLAYGFACVTTTDKIVRRVSPADGKEK